MNNTRPLTIPDHVRGRLDALLGELRACAGDKLAAVVVHGSAVRGGYDVERSDVDVLVVLTDDARDVIDALADPVSVARISARIECMLLRTDELHDAADVFPLLYDDIRRCHALVYGTDPFAGLVIDDHHRRLRVEQELREMRIRLRRVLIDQRGAHGQLTFELQRKRAQLRSALWALLVLRGAAADNDGLDAVYAAAASHLGVDVKPFVALKDGDDLAAVMAAVDALRALLQRGVDAVEAIERSNNGGAP